MKICIKFYRLDINDNITFLLKGDGISLIITWTLADDVKSGSTPRHDPKAWVLSQYLGKSFTEIQLMCLPKSVIEMAWFHNL
jgi:hypothetical protein